VGTFKIAKITLRDIKQTPSRLGAAFYHHSSAMAQRMSARRAHHVSKSLSEGDLLKRLTDITVKKLLLARSSSAREEAALLHSHPSPRILYLTLFTPSASFVVSAAFVVVANWRVFDAFRSNLADGGFAFHAGLVCAREQTFKLILCIFVRYFLANNGQSFTKVGTNRSLHVILN